MIKVTKLNNNTPPLPENVRLLIKIKRRNFQQNRLQENTLKPKIHTDKLGNSRLNKFTVQTNVVNGER